MSARSGEGRTGVCVLVSVYTLVSVLVTNFESIRVVEMAFPLKVIGMTVVCSSIVVRRLVEVWVTR